MLKISKATLERVLKTVRWAERQMRNERPRWPRWQGCGQKGAKTAEVRFRLTADLVPFGSASADLMKWNRATGEWVDAGLDPITVDDLLGVFRCPKDAEGYADPRYWSGGVIYEVNRCQMQAMSVKAMTDGPVAFGDVTFGVDSVALMHPVGGLLPTEAITTFINTFGFAADSGVPAVAWWNETTGYWEGLPLILVNETDVVIANRLSELELQEHLVAITYLGEEEQEVRWHTWHTGVDCE